MVEKIDALFVATYIDFILDFAENTILMLLSQVAHWYNVLLYS